ncbi:MAG: tRNA lysidine(34) synthetase [Peptococcaceae bacterium]
MNKNYSKWFLSKVQNTVKKHQLIGEKDRIAVGLSGGKDSTALLYILWLLKNYSHFDFELFGLHIDPGWKNNNLSSLEYFCQRINVPLLTEKTKISEAIMPRGNLIANPCSLCARLKRGALTKAAHKHNFSKIALGHHGDDFTETLLLNILQGAKFKVFPPRIDYEDKGLSIIRPLVYLEEKTLSALCRKENLPVIPSPCPADGHTRRQEMKELLNIIKKSYPDATRKFVQALDNISCEDIWNPPQEN